MLKPVASAQRAVNVQSAANAMWSNAVKVVAAKAAAHAKTATAVDAAKAAMVKPVMPKAKQPSTTTLHLKPKPKHAPKHATNAWPAKNAAKAPKAATSNANLVLNAANVVTAQNVVKVAKTVANAAHVVSATKAAVNAPLAWTRTATQKSCHSTTQQLLKAKPRKPTRTVASVVSAAHATATAVTAASVATAHRVKKVLQNTPTTATLLSTITQHMTTLQMSKRHKLHLQPKPALACHAFKRSHCQWPTCKPWPKAAVWNGSTPIQNASPPCKPPSQPSPSPCMCHASVHLW